MQQTKNAVNWFEIPVSNFSRAREFYQTILGEDLTLVEAPGATMGFFPADKGSVTGAIIKTDSLVPSDKGSLVYLNGGVDLSPILARVEKAGGQVVLPKMSAGEYGAIARFKDTEGNLVALHSQK